MKTTASACLIHYDPGYEVPIDPRGDLGQKEVILSGDIRDKIISFLKSNDYLLPSNRGGVKWNLKVAFIINLEDLHINVNSIKPKPHEHTKR